MKSSGKIVGREIKKKLYMASKKRALEDLKFIRSSKYENLLHKYVIRKLGIGSWTLQINDDKIMEIIVRDVSESHKHPRDLSEELNDKAFSRKEFERIRKERMHLPDDQKIGSVVLCDSKGRITSWEKDIP